MHCFTWFLFLCVVKENNCWMTLFNSSVNSMIVFLWYSTWEAHQLLSDVSPLGPKNHRPLVLCLRCPQCLLSSVGMAWCPSIFLLASSHPFWRITWKLTFFYHASTLTTGNLNGWAYLLTTSGIWIPIEFSKPYKYLKWLEETASISWCSLCRIGAEPCPGQQCDSGPRI